MGASWQVLSQAPITNVDAGGNVVKGKDIVIRTGEGHQDTIFVPDAVYVNLDKVKAMLQAAADQLDAVGALNSDS